MWRRGSSAALWVLLLTSCGGATSDSLCLARIVWLESKEINALTDRTARDVLYNNELITKRCGKEGS